MTLDLAMKIRRVGHRAGHMMLAAVTLAALVAPASSQPPDGDPSVLIPVRQGDHFGYIDTTGKTVIRFQFDSAFDFSEGLASVRSGKRCGYIDQSGQFAIPYRRYKWCFDFHEGFSAVEVRERHYRFVDRQGSFINGGAFRWADQFSEGLAAVVTRRAGKDSSGYIDKAGRFVIPPTFEDGGRFSEGVAHVKVGGKVGFIDRRGLFVIGPQFDNAYEFSEGLSPVQLNGKWGFIDHEGTFVIPPQFEDVSWEGFHEGLAAAYLEKHKAGYIDRRGHWVVPPIYWRASGFRGGYGYVISAQGGSVGFVDASGHEVLPTRYQEGTSLGQGWFRLQTINEEGNPEIRVTDLKGHIIYRSDARSPRCMHRGPPYPNATPGFGDVDSNACDSQRRVRHSVWSHHGRVHGLLGFFWFTQGPGSPFTVPMCTPSPIRSHTSMPVHSDIWAKPRRNGTARMSVRREILTGNAAIFTRSVRATTNGG